jgi:zinc protease
MIRRGATPLAALATGLFALSPPLPQPAPDAENAALSQVVVIGESFDPTPENIEKRVQRSELPGGVKVALLPKKGRGDTVTAELALHYGNAESLRGHNAAAQVLPALLARGTRKHTRQELEDLLVRLQATLRPGRGVPGTVGFSVQCRKEHLPAVLALLAEVLREPAFPEKEFDALKGRMRDNLARDSKEADILAGIELQRRLNPYPKDDVRYLPTVEESLERIEALTLAEVRKLYDEQLGGQHGEFVVVGDFDPATVARPVATALKDWKSEVKYQRIERPASVDIKGDRFVIETPNKSSAAYAAGLVLPLKDGDPEHAALEAANYLLGGALPSRLGTRLRLKEALASSVSSRYVASAEDRSASFTVNAVCNPANIDKVEAAVKEELEKMLKDGIGEQELAKAKEAYRTSQRNRRGNDGALALLLQQGLRIGRTLAFEAELDKRVEALTTETVNAAFRKHIDPAKLVLIRAGDLRKKTGESP